MCAKQRSLSDPPMQIRLLILICCLCIFKADICIVEICKTISKTFLPPQMNAHREEKDIYSSPYTMMIDCCYTMVNGTPKKKNGCLMTFGHYFSA